MTGAVAYHAGKFPPAHFDWPRLIPLIGPASAAIARYDGLLAAIPNASILLSPLTTQEAVLSSRIEGTQATMGEVLEYEAGGPNAALSESKREDIEEVLNYRKAMRQATEELQNLPLCNRVIKNIHGTLMAGVRGHDKARGEFRTIQNYIGAYGRPITEARFIPIDPLQLEAGMAEWERYVHSAALDVLVQLAVIHAEFESLHPFLDGNGRIGRILIPLFLFERKLLGSPMFYLSEYLESHRQEYCDRLLGVSSGDDWTGWCCFFLKALYEQATTNELRARKILDLYSAKKAWIIDKATARNSIQFLDFMFDTPIFNLPNMLERVKMSATTAKRILADVVEAGMVRVLREGSGRAPSVYAFRELLNIAEGRDVF